MRDGPILTNLRGPANQGGGPPLHAGDGSSLTRRNRHPNHAQGVFSGFTLLFTK